MSEPAPIPEFLACPECQASLRHAPPPPSLPAKVQDAVSGLECTGCGRRFPRLPGIEVLWSDALREAIESEVDEESVSSARDIRKANVVVYDAISENYGEHADGLNNYLDDLLFLKAFADDLQEPAPSGHERVVVDVGCATGFALDLGSRHYPHRVGVDLSRANLEAVAARGHLAILGDAEKLPFRPGSIDLVTCFAAMHHFPSPPEFARSSHQCLRSGGVLLTGSDPSSRSLDRGPLAEVVWDLRKPVYRQLSHFSDRFYLHSDKERQALNDVAEGHRTDGGFDPEAITAFLRSAGFREAQVFFGVDPKGHRRFDVPSWKVGLLQLLSARNPLKRDNWVTLSSISLK